MPLTPQQITSINERINVQLARHTANENIVAMLGSVQIMLDQSMEMNDANPLKEQNQRFVQQFLLMTEGS